MKKIRVCFGWLCVMAAIAAAPGCGPDPVPVGEDRDGGCDQGQVYTVADGGAVYYAYADGGNRD